jgi:regulation of enolase protein 1 (concanavalin A-like superfamily)
MPQCALLAELESLAQGESPSRFRWHCEPRCWFVTEDGLQIKPDAPTDFWQRTHYGHRADNGHFLYCEVDGDFVLMARVAFRPVHQYDQAGVMVRLSAECWLKASVEFEPSGPSRLGAVATSFGYSDWSTQNYSGPPHHIWLRLRREVDDYLVEASNDGEHWDLLRMAHLHGGAGASAACGIYACSPVAQGFVCEFPELSLVAGRLLP